MDNTQPTKECVCPIITIKCHDEHVNKELFRGIARDMCAMLTIKYTNGNSTTMFGPHRDDCPCHKV